MSKDHNSKDGNGLQVDFRFLSTLSHELKSPLFPIIALSDLILRQPQLADDWKTMQSHLEMIQRSGNDLLELIQDIHTLSRLESLRYTPKISTFDLLRFFKEPPVTAEGKGSKTEHLIALKVADSGPQQLIMCDQDALQNIILNLNELCLSYQPVETEQYITVSTRDDQLVLEIRLPHLSPEYVSQVSQPFWKPPWKAVGSRSSNGLKFCLIDRWANTLGGSSTAVAGDDNTRYEVTLPFLTVSLDSPPSNTPDKMILVSDNVPLAYKALLRATKRGHDIILLTSTRYQSGQLPKGRKILVDVQCTEDIEGTRVELPSLTEVSAER